MARSCTITGVGSREISRRDAHRGVPSLSWRDGVFILPDTVRSRRRAVDVSDAYAFRLRTHRYASLTMIPLFVAQSVAGNQLCQADRSGAPRPEWARQTHSAGAAGLGALCTVNTVTGLWNLWDSRGYEVGRTKRWVHTALMLGSEWERRSRAPPTCWSATTESFPVIQPSSPHS